MADVDARGAQPAPVHPAAMHTARFDADMTQRPSASPATVTAAVKAAGSAEQPAPKRLKIATHATSAKDDAVQHPTSGPTLPPAGPSAPLASAEHPPNADTASEPHSGPPNAAPPVDAPAPPSQPPVVTSPADPLAEIPPECSDAWARLLARFPPPPQFLAEVELMFDELHCPVRALQPSAPSRPRAPSHLQHSYCPYSAHMPGWPTHGATPGLAGSSAHQRRVLMHKNLRPQAVAPHSNARRGGGGGGAGRLRASSRDTLDLSDRKCPLCMKTKPYTDFGAGMKARYCRECEKLRWMGRKRSLKVEALRYTLERFGDRLAEMSHQEIVDKACEMFPSAAGGAAERSGADENGASADLLLDASAEESGTPQPPSARHTAADAEQAAPFGRAAAVGATGSGSAEAAPAATQVGAKDAEVDAMAALLEGGSGDFGPAQRPPSPERKCTLCAQTYRPCMDAPHNHCGRCEDLKKVIKSSGHTMDEFKKGLASGHVSLGSPDREAIDSGLRAMLLGQPAAPRKAGASRAQRAASRETP